MTSYFKSMKRRDSSLPNVAFLTMGSPTWTFGTVYLIDLLRALRTTYKDAAYRVFTVDSSAPTDGEIPEVDQNAVRFRPPEKRTLAGIVDRATKRVFFRDLFLERLLRRYDVSVLVFGFFRCGAIPTLSWFPDFQHVHLPDMFSQEERLQRDRELARLARYSQRILVLSETVRAEFARLYPTFAHKVRVLRPVCVVPPSVYESDPLIVAQRYHLPHRFVYMPNQFWKHKNHELAFRAVRLLKEQGLDVFLVCSGYPSDYRHPDHFAQLLESIARAGLRDRIAILGLIPRRDVLALMRQSVYVLNPSLFEGFGMTVEEGKAIGKAVLASDIPAHREQEAPSVSFFKADDVTELAPKLADLWERTPSGPDPIKEEQARDEAPRRMARYAQTFMQLVEEVLAETD